MEQLNISARRQLRLGMLAGIHATFDSDRFAAYEAITAAVITVLEPSDDPPSDDPSWFLLPLADAKTGKEFRTAYRALAHSLMAHGLNIGPI